MWQVTKPHRCKSEVREYTAVTALGHGALFALAVWPSAVWPFGRRRESAVLLNAGACRRKSPQKEVAALIKARVELVSGIPTRRRVLT